MRRLVRIAGYVLGLAVLAVVLTLGWFRMASISRETSSPAEAAGPGARFVRAYDVDMHYKSWGPATGKPLVLIHGTLSWADTWRGIAEPLAAKGFRVIAPDMPPFGYSSKPANQNYGREQAAKRITAFADAIGLKTFSIGVHSYGGGGALEAAFQMPERIEGLVLLDVALGLGVTDPPGPPLAPVLAVPALRTVFSSATFANPMTIGTGLRAFVEDDQIVTEQLVDLYARPLSARGTAEAIGNWIVNGLYGDERKSLSASSLNYKSFTKPVLVIWGRQDKTTPLAQGQKIAGLFPKARLEILDGVDHIPQLEAPARVVDLIAGFLKTDSGSLISKNETPLRPSLD